MFLLMFH